MSFPEIDLNSATLADRNRKYQQLWLLWTPESQPHHFFAHTGTRIQPFQF